MKIRSTLFGALLLCAALVVPTSAAMADQGKSKDKDDPARDDNDRDHSAGDAFALVDRDSNGWITPEELLHRGEPQPR